MTHYRSLMPQGLKVQVILIHLVVVIVIMVHDDLMVMMVMMMVHSFVMSRESL